MDFFWFLLVVYTPVSTAFGIWWIVRTRARMRGAPPNKSTAHSARGEKMRVAIFFGLLLHLFYWIWLVLTSVCITSAMCANWDKSTDIVAYVVLGIYLIFYVASTCRDFAPSAIAESVRRQVFLITPGQVSHRPRRTL